MRNSFSGEQPTNYMSLHPIESVGYAGTANASAYSNRGNIRTANLHSWTTEFDGQPNRQQRYQQQSGVISAHPVTFERKVDPNKFLDAPEIHRPVDIKVIDKAVDRIVEVFQKKPVAKPVERLVEKIEVQDIETVKEFHVTQLIPEVQIIDKEVFYDREVLVEHVEEVYIDKYVERVVEILREVPVDRIVERRVEVIKEIPVVRYVDRVVTREIPIVQVVERVVEILKERPVEVIKEVPVYVRRDASDLETRTTTSYEKVKSSQQFTYEQRHSQRSSTVIGEIRNSGQYNGTTSGVQYTSSPVTTSVTKAGVGMVLERESNGEIFVRKLMNGSPAFNNGSIRVNDKLVSINNTNVQGMLLDKVFDMINGPEGTNINMVLMQGISSYTIDLTRGQVRN